MTGNTGHGQDGSSELADLEREILEAQDALDETVGTAEAADGFVTASVNGRGRLLELKLDPRVFRVQDAEALATGIVDAVQRAGESAQREVYSTLGELMPPDRSFEEVDAEFEAFLHHVKQARGGQW